MNNLVYFVEGNLEKKIVNLLKTDFKRDFLKQTNTAAKLVQYKFNIDKFWECADCRSFIY